MNILEMSHVAKRFGSKQVLADVSFSVPENCIFGFVGRNGAGKTTSMKAMLGLLPVDSGEITVCGERVIYGQSAANRYIGYLPDVPEFYSYMNAAEYLKMCGEICGMKAADIRSRSAELLELVGLANEKHRIKGYSRGMKQRLGIAQALINRPRLLICDEPTSALDPVGRREILDILAAAKAHTSVFFSTHILSDVEKHCDEVAFLENGRIVLSGAIDEIKRIRPDTAIEVITRNPDDVKQLLAEFPAAALREGSLVLENASDEEAERLMQCIVTRHIPVLRWERREPDLEKLFMEVIGK